MFEAAKSRFNTFIYNFRWDDYATFLGGPFARIALFVPIAGYLVIFNDLLINNSDFQALTNETSSTFYITSEQRTRFVYFGLIFVAVSNFLYLRFRPSVMRNGTSASQYLEFAKSNFTVRDFMDIQARIAKYGHKTQYGNDNLDQWDDFLAASGAVKYNELKKSAGVSVDFTQAISKFEGLIRSLIIDHYTEAVSKRQKRLAMALFLALTGYFLLLIPSADLFFRVVQLSFIA